ncbi:RING/U-box superfamily protein [Striga hermonthica]|uniref:RING/U-box superfamily protein n=1 Tax=Striga hermonthica TaxID=68872 RepID=A0A9N7RB81_STRHE|nr:RING/U-box superfamily protein [Striga hermonthica]
MAPDSIPNASVAVASPNSKDSSKKKKKRGNRSVKLKQCKLDVRRDQWLYQVNNKDGCKEDHNSGCVSKPVVKPTEEDVFSDSNSWLSKSPISPVSSLLGINDSGVNITASSRSSIGSCSMNEEENDYDDENEDDGDCFDDWESMADALAAEENNLQRNRPNEPLYSESVLARDGLMDEGSDPISCPICAEDLDSTDSRFFPCLCGFRLCLFCHKRILEGDGRCPGCRKDYDCGPVEGEAIVNEGSWTFKLARSRSCSTMKRS